MTLMTRRAMFGSPETKGDQQFILSAAAPAGTVGMKGRPIVHVSPQPATFCSSPTLPRVSRRTCLR